MLEPIRQNEGTNDSERYLVKLARNSFFRLWSYPGLSVRGKRGIAKELTDLTVVFGDDILLFSDKNIAWPVGKETKTAWRRWFRESIAESAKQLWGAERQLKRGEKVFLDEKLSQQIPMEVSSATARYHLIAVVANSGIPARNYFEEVAPGSNGTLVFNMDIPADSVLDHPFVIGDLEENKTFVHVFDEETIERLVSELGTISDFVHYLTEKVQAIRQGYLRGAAGEEEILAFYLQEETQDGFGSLQQAMAVLPDNASLHIPEKEWAMFEASPEYKVRRARHENAEGWAGILREFDVGIVGGNAGEANHIPLEVHERTLRVAASENLYSRAWLASNWTSKSDQVPTNARSARIVSSFVRGRVYVFLFVPWVVESVSYREYRSYRLSLMQAYSVVLPLKAIGVREAIIIGAQPKGMVGFRSETMIFVNYDQPMTPEEVRAATELMVTEKILDTTQARPLHELSPKTILGGWHGRNDPCPCGSGRKNKKCCRITGRRKNPIYALSIGPEAER